MNCRSNWQDSVHTALWGEPEGAHPGQTLSVHCKEGNLPLGLAAIGPDGGDPAESQVLCQGKGRGVAEPALTSRVCWELQASPHPVWGCSLVCSCFPWTIFAMIQLDFNSGTY